MSAAAIGVLLAIIGAAVPPAASARTAPVSAPDAQVPVADEPILVVTDKASQGGLATGWSRVAGAGPALTLNGRPVPVAPDGRFIIGFDRDAPPVEVLRATVAPGSPIELRLAVAPRSWRIERLSMLARHPLPDAAFDAVRAPELARIAAARAAATDAQGWRQRFIWPAAGRQSGWFGSQRVYAGEPGAYHTGADVAVPDGTPVRAPADGVVILAADHPFTLEGNLLMIDHGQGLSSALLHLSRIDVREGDHVRQGQVVGLSGHTGRATGPHVHWGLRWREARLDPLLVAGPPPAQR